MRQQTLTERRALAAYRGHHGHQKLVCPLCDRKFTGPAKLAKHAIKKHEVKQ
jgi:hypothetical protein